MNTNHDEKGRFSDAPAAGAAKALRGVGKMKSSAARRNAAAQRVLRARETMMAEARAMQAPSPRADVGKMPFRSTPGTGRMDIAKQPKGHLRKGYKSFSESINFNRQKHAASLDSNALRLSDAAMKSGRMEDHIAAAKEFDKYSAKEGYGLNISGTMAHFHKSAANIQYGRRAQLAARVRARSK